jgi:hypothetical protein
VVSALGLASAGFTGLALYAAQEVATNGPDLAGVALVISAVAGLISAATAMVIALRRKPTDPEVVALLREITARNQDQP